MLDLPYNELGLAYSIIGLALVIPILVLVKQYFRFLDALQFVVAWSLSLALTRDNVFGFRYL